MEQIKIFPCENLWSALQEVLMRDQRATVVSLFTQFADGHAHIRVLFAALLQNKLSGKDERGAP